MFILVEPGNELVETFGVMEQQDVACMGIGARSSAFRPEPPPSLFARRHDGSIRKGFQRRPHMRRLAARQWFEEKGNLVFEATFRSCTLFEFFRRFLLYCFFGSMGCYCHMEFCMQK